MVTLQNDRDEAERLYGQAVTVFRTACQGLDSGAIAYPPLEAAVGGLHEALRRGNSSLVAMTAKSTAGNYLYAHSVNVAILSMHVGLGAGLEAVDVGLLGVSALLHDLGMTKYLALTQVPRPLTKEEYQEIQLHPVESRKLLGHLRDVEESTRLTLGEIVSADHAKPSGGEAVHRLSQIIALCDMYEAMSHARSWREAMLPSDAINTLLKRHAQQFPRPLVKVFLERLSLFPPGSYVRLSGGEIGRVISTHPKLPTRPTVEVVLRRDLSPMNPPLLINLAEKPLTHISRPVDETKLAVRDTRSQLALQAGRWWVG